MLFETNGLKVIRFQGIETERFQHGVKLMSTCSRLTVVTHGITHGDVKKRRV